MKLLYILFFSFFLITFQGLFAQESDLDIKPDIQESEDDGVDTDFNFGEVKDEGAHFSVSVGGGVYVGITPFFADMKNIKELKPSSLCWAHIHLDAQAPLTHAYINLNLNDQTLPISLGNKWATSETNKIPRWLDEAYLQVSMSAVYLSCGLKKITWGRADVLSVLDVVNPHDMTELLSPDTAKKIGVPLLHLFAYTPHDIKIEAVFLPMFTPHLLAIEGRWKPFGMQEVQEFSFATTKEDLQSVFKMDTAKFKFAHTGVRLSTTFANAHDVGLQYFYGHSKRPLIRLYGTSALTEYLPIHHIGLDYGTAIGSVNLKLEACANVVGMEQLKDSNLEWNAGFSSPLTHGLFFNLVFKETIWMYSIKAHESNVLYSLFRRNRHTETTSFLSLSQVLLRGAFEWKLAFMVCLEDVDFAILPSVHAMFGTIIFDAQLGIFLGRDYTGTFSQYHRNNYLRLSFGYEF